MITRKTPMSMRNISKSIRTVLSHASDDIPALHLLPCDYEVAKRKPVACGVAKQSDDQLVVASRGRLIPVLPSE